MNFIWPQMLWSLLLIPLLAAVYIWLLKRKKRAALRYANLSMVKEAMGRSGRWRRHVPPLLFLLALATLLVALARPTAVVMLPAQKQTIILVMDVSGSMRATDVEPTRLEAAQEAAKSFVKQVPRYTRIGVVAFAGTASLVQAPTDRHQDVVAAIERFQLQRATAIGSGILVALATLFPDGNIDLSQLLYGPAARFDKPPDPKQEQFEPVPPGSHESAAIVLLTDGQATMGPDPIEMAKMAADRGVRVYTVGVGTADGEIIHFEGWTMRVRLDEETLKQIAGITRAEYYRADNAADLKKVYETLGARLVLEERDTEITVLFAAAAAVLALASGLLSLAWFNRIL